MIECRSESKAYLVFIDYIQRKSIVKNAHCTQLNTQAFNKINYILDYKLLSVAGWFGDIVVDKNGL